MRIDYKNKHLLRPYCVTNVVPRYLNVSLISFNFLTGTLGR